VLNTAYSKLHNTSFMEEMKSYILTEFVVLVIEIVKILWSKLYLSIVSYLVSIKEVFGEKWVSFQWPARDTLFSLTLPGSIWELKCIPRACASCYYWPLCYRAVVFNLFCSRTPRYNFSSTLYPQSCWYIMQVLHIVVSLSACLPFWVTFMYLQW
jgi:hypothetical protein